MADRPSKPTRPSPSSWWKAPFNWGEWCIEWLAYGMSHLAIFTVLDYASKLTVLIAAIAYISTLVGQVPKSVLDKSEVNIQVWAELTDTVRWLDRALYYSALSKRREDQLHSSFEELNKELSEKPTVTRPREREWLHDLKMVVVKDFALEQRRARIQLNSQLRAAKASDLNDLASRTRTAIQDLERSILDISDEGPVEEFRIITRQVILISQVLFEEAPDPGKQLIADFKQLCSELRKDPLEMSQNILPPNLMKPLLRSYYEAVDREHERRRVLDGALTSVLQAITFLRRSDQDIEDYVSLGRDGHRVRDTEGRELIDRLRRGTMDLEHHVKSRRPLYESWPTELIDGLASESK